MKEKYNPSFIENKWQEIWEKENTYKVSESGDKQKYYFLEMFAYPSGDLHWGHLRNYTIGDVSSRYLTHKGYNVLHPTGFDAFGLPAENAAIKRGVDPKAWTYLNIDNMVSQFKKMGYSYDWDRQIITCSPEYYKWNQWLFIQLYKAGLCYKKNSPVNWCEGCKTALANEQVIGGVCERCDTPIIKRPMEQWYLKITDYAERMLDGLDKIDWPEDVVTMQRNWIGKSCGVEFGFTLSNCPEKEAFRVFTTRPDTIFGVTFIVLAPEHPLVDEITTDEQRCNVEALKKEVSTMSEIDRSSTELEKKGAFTGAYAVNPLNNEKIPVWIANYVMLDYGTGAIMAVPAHDQRDFEFAKKYDISIKIVISPEGSDLKAEEMEVSFPASGIMVDSGKYSGIKSSESWGKIADELEAMGIGERTVNYRIRDWGISRQRYWGTPIPMIYCEKCGVVHVPEADLPVLLPEDVNFNTDAKTPLATSDDFVNTICPQCGMPAKRDVDTMDTFFCSSWYFLRYCSPKDDGVAFNKESVKYWMPVDQYVGGREHATMHLIYARFFTMALHDIGLIDFDEPFTKLFNQGIVTAGGKKMSKRSGAVPPNDVVDDYGADSARLFILFMAPAGDRAEWGIDPQTGMPYTIPPNIDGIFRFLSRIWRHIEQGRYIYINDWKEALSAVTLDSECYDLRRKTHQTLKKVSNDIERFQFNTAISAMMELVNDMYKTNLDKENLNAPINLCWSEAVEFLVRMLSPFAPHLASELYEELGFEDSLIFSEWPKADDDAAKNVSIEVPVQINGKIKAKLQLSADASPQDMEKAALENESVKAASTGKEIVKIIVVPKKLVNIVLR